MNAEDFREAKLRSLTAVQKRRRVALGQGLAATGYVALGILLYVAWRRLKEWGSPGGWMGAASENDPRYRLAEVAFFLLIAAIPLVIWLVRRLFMRRRK